MLGDHLFRGHFRSDSNSLLLELLLSFRIDDLGVFAIFARLLLRVDLLLTVVLTNRHRLPLLHILVLVVARLRVDNVRFVIVHNVATYGRRATADSGR